MTFLEDPHYVGKQIKKMENIIKFRNIKFGTLKEFQNKK